jgi:hypothetical protein
MDEQLRANPADLVALMRAGRLSPERVAMAAYLGDERALATGVEPWEPPKKRQKKHGLARPVLRFGDLTDRQRVWLACLCVRGMLDRHWRGEGLPQLTEALELTRAWCRGEVVAEADQARALGAPAFALGELDVDDDPEETVAGQVSHAVSFVVEAAFGAPPTNPTYQRPTEDCLRAIDAALSVADAEGADDEPWQAQALADGLLDPAWPPWEE